MIRIVVDGAPVAKGRGRVGRMGNGAVRVFTPAKTRTYEDVLRYAAGQAMQGRDPFDQALSVAVVAYLPIPASFSRKKREAALEGVLLPTKRPDGDNYLKAALDGCNGVVWRDDSIIVDMTVQKRYATKPQLIIQVEPIG